MGAGSGIAGLMCTHERSGHTGHCGVPHIPQRVWQLWSDRRLLERWWGPPEFPATFGSLDLRPGGGAADFMTGPDGTTHHGWWRILAVEEPHRLRCESSPDLDRMIEMGMQDGLSQAMGQMDALLD